jgi:superfamily II DNA or RNA helicase
LRPAGPNNSTKMLNIVQVNYAQTGASAHTNALGMREMQQKAYQARDAQYLLLKAPPASGKSRALMFIALDKLVHQNIQKVIVAVPERAIGNAFAPTKLKKHGFFMDWELNDAYNLCIAGADNNQSKVKMFHRFMTNDEKILICTHATLRFAYAELEPKLFNNTLLAIDEFHHVSAGADSILGEVLRDVMAQSSAHVVAMTGSYFRGDTLPVLSPETEALFTKVTYNYYNQLNGYQYLKSLGIGYHFYQGKYTSAILDVLDTDKKTILHIPNVNTGESTKDKYKEVDTILDAIGDVQHEDEATGILYVKRHQDGKILKIADLVNDEPKNREKVLRYLRNITSATDMDLIIALGMAKEGFDWTFCEHALTIGYRGSLTEIIQIIGRCTRDSPNKTHAQFTNLIAQPDAAQASVQDAVNNMLKAITASLLMEQVLAPNFKFKTKLSEDDLPEAGEIKVRGFKTPSTQRVKAIIETDLNDLKANLLQNSTIQSAFSGNIDPEVINKVLIPKLIQTKYPHLSETEIEEVRQHIVLDSVVKNHVSGDKRFIQMADKFINIDDLHIDLIDQVNPFQKAYEILSKSVTPKVLKTIQEVIAATRIQVTEAEAVLMWEKIKAFHAQWNRPPQLDSTNPLEKRMAEVLIYIREQKRKRQHGN